MEPPIAHLRTEAEEALAQRLIDWSGDGDAVQLARDIVDHIGSADAELRDELGFTRLTDLVLTGRVDRDVLVEFVQTALGKKGIHHSLGESGTDSVFRRSFSVLLLVLIVHKDNEHSFVSDETWIDLISGIETYCRTEEDHRSLIPLKGWAHAIAHTADLIDEIAQSPRAKDDEVRRLHDALVSFVGRTSKVFDAAEEDRVGRALSGVIRRVGVEHHRDVVLRFSQPLGTAAAANLKQVVRSLFFRADVADRTVLEALEAALTN